MQISLDTNSATNIIQEYTPGQLTINQTVFNESVIISPKGNLERWRPKTLDDIQESDLEFILNLNPEICIVGSGEHQGFLKPLLMHAFLSKGIGVEVMSTSAACRTFNVLTAEERNVVAALLC